MSVTISGRLRRPNCDHCGRIATGSEVVPRAGRPGPFIELYACEGCLPALLAVARILRGVAA